MNKSRLFDLSLYDYQMICKAASEYRQLMNTQILTKGEFVQCIFSDCLYDTDLTIDEFSNYALGLTIQKGAADVLD